MSKRIELPITEMGKTTREVGWGRGWWWHEDKKGNSVIDTNI